MLVQRMVARASFNGKQEDFNNFWPLPKQYVSDPVKKVWGSPEEFRDWRDAIQKAHGIKIA